MYKPRHKNRCRQEFATNGLPRRNAFVTEGKHAGHQSLLEQVIAASRQAHAVEQVIASRQRDADNAEQMKYWTNIDPRINRPKARR